MIVTTTNKIEGLNVKSYYGVVTGEAVIGADIFTSQFMTVQGIAGGRVAEYGHALEEARDIAVFDMQDRAASLGASAVVGVQIGYGVINNLLMVTASGTAVTTD